MKSMALAIFFSLFFFSQANAWVLEANFEKGTVGQLAKGDSGFGKALSSTVYSSEQTHSGSRSAKSSIKQNSNGGEWGGLWNLPSILGEGDELWYRVWVYYPPGFSFACGCPEGIKFMRVRTYDSSGASFHGSWDYYLHADGIILASGVNSTEFYDNHKISVYPWYDMRYIDGPITLGTWHAFEIYVKFSATSGGGIVRLWKDGKLFIEDTITATLKSNTSTVRMVSLWTYWNNSAPQNQSAYVDDVLITNERPSNTDSKGNPFIGVGDIEFVARPNPPAPY